ncbi:MAG TPA: dihydropteroate synthase, partial [Myxococcota bacterium]
MSPRLLCGGRALPLGERTLIMGIVNLTPDSFSDGGALASVDDAVAHALTLVNEGADVVDLGGESTRPGAAPISADEERARVLPVVEALVQRGVRNLSIDTRNASVARACMDAGASWINDVTALEHDAAMAEVCARADVEGVVLMHWPAAVRARWAQGSTGSRSDDVEYGADEGGVVGAVRAYLAARVRAAVSAGVPAARIVVDPGLGFGKSVDDNMRLLNAGSVFCDLGAVLMGPSRKRFVGALAGGIPDPKARGAATLGAVAAA